MYKPQPLDPLHYALNLMGEESSEIGQQIAKILRFGLLDGPPGSQENNLDLLQKELSDLMANIRIVNHELRRQGLPTLRIDDEEQIFNKMKKVDEFGHYSIKLGTLTDLLAFMPGEFQG